MSNAIRLIIFSLSTLLISCNQTKKQKLIDDKILRSKLSDSINKLSDKPAFKVDAKVKTLILDYNAISCSCAQWSESKSNKKEYYWLEPANEQLINADHLFNGRNLPIQIKVTGQIVSENGFPKQNTLSKVGENEAGKVFRYTNIEVLKK
ncbi:hypothetical protein [Chryseobacterium geocarposphaerae]|uniref:Uncharacterized protein n=1 Tax=Chryseobacterium geocarposphaerae TaxID=1416776 RepID=A0A2M9C668_9FLAO|nr:hypothetical protein [Chryseobacterium geocarposphaerae]PJJ66351.1 hypothetical protein CLV73_0320 [Chryseobacterium geocarposphaerae]